MSEAEGGRTHSQRRARALVTRWTSCERPSRIMCVSAHTSSMSSVFPSASSARAAPHDPVLVGHLDCRCPGRADRARTRTPAHALSGMGRGGAGRHETIGALTDITATPHTSSYLPARPDCAGNSGTTRCSLGKDVGQRREGRTVGRPPLPAGASREADAARVVGQSALGRLHCRECRALLRKVKSRKASSYGDVLPLPVGASGLIS